MVISSSCLLCGWDAQEAPPEARVAASGRGSKPSNKDVTGRDLPGRFSQRHKYSRSNSRSYIFQHLATAHEHIVAYREQLSSHFNYCHGGTAMSTMAYTAPAAQHSSKVQWQAPQTVSEDSFSNTYLNGVWSVAHKYNLAPPSLLQYTNWWQQRPQAGPINGPSSIATNGTSVAVAVEPLDGANG